MTNIATQFKKGNKFGVHKGAPKRDWSWAELYAEASEETKDGNKKKKIVANKVFDLAMRGDMVAVKEISSRMDGMPTEHREVENKGEINIVYLPHERTKDK